MRFRLNLTDDQGELLAQYWVDDEPNQGYNLSKPLARGALCDGIVQEIRHAKAKAARRETGRG